MGYNTLKFSNEIKKRTYVQGEFMGKYFGSISDKIFLSKTELYDIQIYEGEISNLKNDKEHPEIINETIYNAITSETQLTQNSFENILVHLNTTIKDYDSIKLAIREPKLEIVQIYDVVKEGNNTFGTLTCLVSGYLLETTTKMDEMQVETCNTCGEYFEECTCEQFSPTVTVDNEVISSKEVFEETHWESISKTFNKENRAKLWNEIQTSGFGCLGFIGLLFGLLFLLSYGLNGIFAGLFLALLYVLGAFFSFFPRLPRHWRQLLYFFLGILLIGLFLNLFERSGSYMIEDPIFENTETRKENLLNDLNNNSTSETNMDGQNKYYNTANSINDIIDSKEESELLKKTDNFQLEQTITLYKDTIDGINTSNLNPKNSQANSDSNIASNKTKEIKLDITTDSSQLNYYSKEFKQTNNELINVTKESNSIKIQKTTAQNEMSKSDIKDINETTNNLSNNTEMIINDTLNQKMITREKIKRVPEIMGSTVFREGEIYVCKEDENQFYHLSQNCIALNDCTSTIYKTNIPVAEREGRSLCELEK